MLERKTITFGTRKARVPVAKVLRAPEWPCPVQAPGGAPSGPKITKTGPPCLRGGVQKVPLSTLMDKINLGTVWVPFGRVWAHVAPKRCPLGQKWVHLAPECVLRAETEKWPYLGLERLNRESVDIYPTCKPPL